MTQWLLQTGKLALWPGKPVVSLATLREEFKRLPWPKEHR
jgi:hypothetical protein